VVPIIGWLVGVVLLWASDAWTTREKLIGTLVVPGGLALPLFLLAMGAYSETCSAVVGGPVTCTGGPSQAMQVVGSIVVTALFLAPLVTTAHLARRMGRSSVSAAV
jgi:ABC-type Mn2+/Zn2+ transport system permease subunit